MDIAKFRSILDQLPTTTRLVAVSKTKPASDIAVLYEQGQRLFGENKALELKEKYESLPKDIEWHFIGHLQSNKIKYIAPFVSMIEAVDSFKLLQDIDRQAVKFGRVIPCLLEFHIAKESTKFGFCWDECVEMLRSAAFRALQHVEIHGVMGMATFTDNQAQICDEFRTLRHYFDELKRDFFADKSYFKDISMGMTDDYPIAIEEGSTIIRVGSAIFGNRNYNQ